MFFYPTSKSDSRLIFIPKNPNMGKSDVVDDWSEFYMGAQEAIMYNVPKPLGKGVIL